MGNYFCWLLARPPGSLMNWWSHIVIRLTYNKSAAAFRARIARERTHAPERPASWLLSWLYGVGFEEQLYYDSGA